MGSFFETHRATLDKALEAIKTRDYWSAYPEAPSGRIYGETANKDGLAAFDSYKDSAFDLAQPGTVGQIGEEVSPYGFPLNITYPQADLDVLLPAAQAAMKTWAKADINTRTGVCLEILHRLNQRSFELGYAVMHTTGQGFMMAFQAGAPHAQDRGLEAVAYAYDEMQRTPTNSRWTKPQGKHDPLVMDKKYRVVPRGVSLMVGCSTFPTWNSYSGLFASLATGNAVVIKPHPKAVLPLAITAKIAREVIVEAGFDANLVTLATDSQAAPITAALATRPEVRIVDYTGSTQFGDWIEDNARQAVVYTEKAGVNSIVIDSIDDFKGMVRNLSFSLSLYSGQMCTTPQNIFIPKTGIRVGDDHMSFDDVANAIAQGVSKFLSDPDRAAEVLGAIQNPATAERIAEASKLGDVVLASEAKTNPRFENASVHSPVIMKLDANQEDIYMQELFGPIAFVIATDSTEDSLERAARGAREHGAITSAIYSANDEVLEQAEDLMAEAGVALSCNLTGGVFVNQSAAFSDFHATGGNPAANASLTDSAFVSSRFRIVQSRRHAVTVAV